LFALFAQIKGITARRSRRALQLSELDYRLVKAIVFGRQFDCRLVKALQVVCDSLKSLSRYGVDSL
jgi:hypothetical protein